RCLLCVSRLVPPRSPLSPYTTLFRSTGHTITNATALRRELRKIRSQGWALVDQELEEGLRSIAAPIRDADGQVIAAINVSTHARSEEHTSELQSLAYLVCRLLLEKKH